MDRKRAFERNENADVGEIHTDHLDLDEAAEQVSFSPQVRRDLDYLSSGWDVENKGYIISSHRPFAGRFLITGRQIFHDEVRRYVDPAISKQKDFNGSTVRVLNEMVKKLAEISLRIDGLEEMIRTMKADAGISGKLRISRIFTLPFEPFGIDDTERCIEIPWAISCYNGEKTVLDIGYANAEERYLRELLSLNVPSLYGIDVIGKDISGIIPIKGDIKKTSFPDEFFDLIFCISTIEHVGRDNSVYGYSDIDEEGDFNAIKEMCRITKKGGIIIITAPYGKFQDYGWFIHYDKKRWRDLISTSKCKILKEDFFIYNGGWHSSKADDLTNILYKTNDAPAAAGLVCIMLEK